MAKKQTVEIKTVDPETEQARKSLDGLSKTRKTTILNQDNTDLLLNLLTKLGAKVVIVPIRSGVYREGKEAYGQIVDVRAFSFIVDKTT